MAQIESINNRLTLVCPTRALILRRCIYQHEREGANGAPFTAKEVCMIVTLM